MANKSKFTGLNIQDAFYSGLRNISGLSGVDINFVQGPHNNDRPYIIVDIVGMTEDFFFSQNDASGVIQFSIYGSSATGQRAVQSISDALWTGMVMTYLNVVNGVGSGATSGCIYIGPVANCINGGVRIDDTNNNVLSCIHQYGFYVINN